MRQTLIAVALLVGMVALVRSVPPSGGTAATPAAPLRAATPVLLSEAEVLATRVAELEGGDAAQTVAQIELELRVDELEQGLAPVLEGLPEQAAVVAFLQGQIDDLQARVGTLEEAATSPMVSTGHLLVGTWAVVDDAAGSVPGLAVFAPEGTVVIVSPGGGTAIGAWAATGAHTAVGVWVYPSAAAPAEGGDVTAVRAQITVDAAGMTASLTYQVVEITARGRVAERGDGTASGTRVLISTPAPGPATPSS